eukprot:jgi/Chlat1/3628/Chrsp237S03622
MAGDMAGEGRKEIVRVLGVIPARYASTRFPGKPLAQLGGKPMVQHTYENAKKSASLDRLVVATDDEVREERTERCLEVMNTLAGRGETYDIIGDEPFIEPEHVDAVVAVVRDDPNAVMGFTSDTHTHSTALYFSRSVIPASKSLGGRFDPRLSGKYLRKLGIYCYRRGFLPEFVNMPNSMLQEAEDLEQNKVIEAGYRIKVGIVKDAIHGVDTPEQLEDLQRRYCDNNGTAAATH